MPPSAPSSGSRSASVARASKSIDILFEEQGLDDFAKAERLSDAFETARL